MYYESPDEKKPEQWRSKKNDRVEEILNRVADKRPESQITKNLTN